MGVVNFIVLDSLLRFFFIRDVPAWSRVRIEWKTIPEEGGRFAKDVGRRSRHRSRTHGRCHHLRGSEYNALLLVE